ncbi:alpha/beta hydrolase [Streptomyces sp. NPDC041068]|uniref:alpha/beta fold hydrolase n=1 Tax=Streptomyces sp. NPDC041068 TaxID=3155130 RepID=UPI0033D83213
MKLHTHTWGTGDRVAVLVHGLMSDHRTWHRLGPALAGRGYRVVGVDLRGHGNSPRGGYELTALADDLTHALPPDPELAIGHSLGGLLLGLAADRLGAKRCVYADPTWATAAAERARSTADKVAAMGQFKGANRSIVRGFNRRWDAADVRVEAEARAAWDPESAAVFDVDDLTAYVPEAAVVPSLVLAAADNPLTLSEADRADLTARGFEVRVVRARHCIHYEDFDAFVATLDDWL